MARSISSSFYHENLKFNVHMQYGNTAYSNAQLVVDGLNYVGASGFHDAPATGGMQEAAARQSYLLDHGFDAVWTTGGNFQRSYLNEQFNVIYAHRDSTRGVEGPNEPHFYDGNPGYNYGGIYGPAGVLAQQHDIAEFTHSFLPNADVIAPSSPGWMEYHPDFYKTPDANVANAHVYGPVTVVNGVPATNIAWALNSNLTYSVPYATNATSWALTEGGGNSSPTNIAYTPEIVKAETMLKIVVGAFGAGASLVIPFELFSDGPNGDKGWQVMNDDGSPTLAGFALHNLSELVKDSSSNADLVNNSSFNYSVYNAANPYSLGVHNARSEIVFTWGDRGVFGATIDYGNAFGWINDVDLITGQITYLGWGSTSQVNTSEAMTARELVRPVETMRFVQGLYDTVFDRVGEAGGVRWHTEAIVVHGTSEHQIAVNFANAANNFNWLDDASFVRTLYNNAWERPAAQWEVDVQTGWLGAGNSRASLIEAFAHDAYTVGNVFQAVVEENTLIG